MGQIWGNCPAKWVSNDTDQLSNKLRNALIYCDVEEVRQLLDQGADPNHHVDLVIEERLAQPHALSHSEHMSIKEEFFDILELNKVVRRNGTDVIIVECIREPCAFAHAGNVTSKEEFITILQLLVDKGFQFLQENIPQKNTFIENTLFACVHEEFSGSHDFISQIEYLLVLARTHIGEQRTQIYSSLLYDILDFSQGYNEQVFRILSILNRYAEFCNWTYRGIQGETPLHKMMYTSQAGPEWLELAIEGGGDINAQDIFGFTPLHVAVASHNRPMIDALIEKGADIEKCHIFGWDPLSMNSSRGRMLVHSKQSDNMFIDLDTVGRPSQFDILVQQFPILSQFDQFISGLAANENNQNYSFNPNMDKNTGSIKHILESSYFGLTDTKSPSATFVYGHIQTLVSRVVETICQLDPLFACTLVTAGSWSEGTKIGKPDEFDFNLIMTNLSQCHLQVEFGIYRNLFSALSSDGIFIGFDETNEALKQWTGYTTTSVSGRKVLCPKLLVSRLHKLITNILSQPETWTNLMLCWSSERIGNPIALSSNSVLPIRLMWMGDDFHEMLISIDLMPMFNIVKWPDGYINRHCKLLTNNPDQNCLVMIKHNKFRLTASKMEQCIMKNLSLTDKMAYCTCKALVSAIRCLQEKYASVNEIYASLYHGLPTSFELKNALFFVNDQNFDSQQATTDQYHENIDMDNNSIFLYKMTDQEWNHVCEKSVAIFRRIELDNHEIPRIVFDDTEVIDIDKLLFNSEHEYIRIFTRNTTYHNITQLRKSLKQFVL